MPVQQMKRPSFAMKPLTMELVPKYRVYLESFRTYAVGVT